MAGRSLEGLSFVCLVFLRSWGISQSTFSGDSRSGLCPFFIRSQKTFDSASQPKLRGTSHLPFQIPFSWQSCQGPYSQIGLLLFNWPPSRIIGALLHFVKRLGKSLSWNNLWLLHLILLWCELLGPECRNLRILQKVLQNSKIYCIDKSVTAKLISWWNESSIVYLHP